MRANGEFAVVGNEVGDVDEDVRDATFSGGPRDDVLLELDNELLVEEGVALVDEETTVFK